MMKKILLALLLFLLPIFILILIIYIKIDTSKKYHKRVDVEYNNQMTKESSGLIKSSKYENIYYTHDDSKSKEADSINYLYAFSFVDENNAKYGKWEYKIQLEDTINIDWEDISITDDGKIIIGDIGNNFNNRKYFYFYIFDEPEKNQKLIKSEDIKKIAFRIAEVFWQDNNEALFYYEDSIYILTKELWGRSKLYKLNLNKVEEKELYNLEFINNYTDKGIITGADISPDKKKLAILTYDKINIYDISKGLTFDNLIKTIPLEINIRYRQYEGITFVDNNKLIISTEQGAFVNEVNKNIGMRILEYDI